MNITFDELSSKIKNVLQKGEFNLIKSALNNSIFLHSRTVTFQRNVTTVRND